MELTEYELIYFTIYLSVDYATFETRGDRIYRTGWVPVSGESSLVFKVKACKEAFLALCQVQGHVYTLSYEFALGVNAGIDNELRYGVDGEAKDNNQAQVLSCDEMREFWVSWSNGDITLGQGGNVGQDQLLSWNDVNPYDINAVSLTTRKYITAEWEFVSKTGTV